MDYILALSLLKTGFISSNLADNFDADERSLILARVSDLEMNIIQSFPTHTEPLDECTLVGLLKGG